MGLPVTLYAFGNRAKPRSPRRNIDIKVENDYVKSTKPPTGHLPLLILNMHHFRDIIINLSRVLNSQKVLILLLTVKM